MFYRKMRKKYLGSLRNQKILEIGVGTGKNLKYYHKSNQVWGFDRSAAMLREAMQEREKRNLQHVHLSLQEDIPWNLPTSDFDVVIATFVMCTMRNPAPVFREILTHISPGKRLIIFEYTKPKSRFLRFITVLLNPLTKLVFGVDFKRSPSIEYRGKSWEVVNSDEIMGDMLKVINLRSLESEFVS